MAQQFYPLVDVDWLQHDRYQPSTYRLIDQHALDASHHWVHDLRAPPALYADNVLQETPASIPFTTVGSAIEPAYLTSAFLLSERQASTTADANKLVGLEYDHESSRDGGLPFDGFPFNEDCVEAAPLSDAEAYRQGTLHGMALALAYSLPAPPPHLVVRWSFQEGMDAGFRFAKQLDGGPTSAPTTNSVFSESVSMESPSMPVMHGVLLPPLDCISAPTTAASNSDIPASGLVRSDDTDEANAASSFDLPHKTVTRRRSKNSRCRKGKQIEQASESSPLPLPHLSGNPSALRGPRAPSITVVAMIVLMAADKALPVEHLQLLIEVLDRVAGWGSITEKDRTCKAGWRKSLQQGLSKIPLFRKLEKCLPSSGHDPLTCLGQCNLRPDCEDPKGQAWALDLAEVKTKPRGRLLYAQAQHYRVPFSVSRYLEELRDSGLLPETERFVSARNGRM